MKEEMEDTSVGEAVSVCLTSGEMQLYLFAECRVVHSHWSRSVEALPWSVDIKDRQNKRLENLQPGHCTPIAIQALSL